MKNQEIIHNIYMNIGDIENIFLPVYFENKKIQFTNIGFQSNSSGNEYFLIKINNNYKFLLYGHEADCDGAYFFYHIINIFDVFNNEYKPLKNLYKKDIFNILNQYNNI
jgi:hypothetical protein